MTDELKTTVAEWQAALADATSPTRQDSPGYTFNELAQMLHMGPKRLRAHLAVAIAQGTCNTKPGIRHDSRGRIYHVQVYQLSKAL